MSGLTISNLESPNSFFTYLNRINKIPSLLVEEEYSLARDFINNQTITAAQKLVESHLKLVAKIALSFRSYGIPIIELISEGNIGLIQAVRKFDPEKGFRLSTYAMWWIKAAIQEYILKSWSLVKIGTTAAQKRLFFNLNRIKKKIFNLEGRDFNHSDFAQAAIELNVSVNDVAEMNVRMKQDRYLDQPLGTENDTSLLEVIPSKTPNQEVIFSARQELEHKRSLFYKAFATLSEREQYIINARKLADKPSTLEDLSVYFAVSKERIRQIEEKALEKLTSFVALNNQANTISLPVKH